MSHLPSPDSAKSRSPKAHSGHLFGGKRPKSCQNVWLEACTEYARRAFFRTFSPDAVFMFPSIEGAVDFRLHCTSQSTRTDKYHGGNAVDQCSQIPPSSPKFSICCSSSSTSPAPSYTSYRRASKRMKLLNFNRAQMAHTSSRAQQCLVQQPHAVYAQALLCGIKLRRRVQWSRPTR